MDPAFSAKQDVNALLTVADARGADFSDTHPEYELFVTLDCVAARRSVQADGLEGPPFVDTVGVTKMRRQHAQLDGPQPPIDRISWSMDLSGERSAARCLSFRLSSSRYFKRLSSDGRDRRTSFSSCRT